MAHDPRQAALVGVEHAIEVSLGDGVKFAVTLAAGRSQKARAQHRRQGQRDEARDQDGGADRHGELMQQAAQNAAHEQHRDKHGGEREGHREYRETDFRGPIERRRHHVLAHLHVAHDVLEHDDGVIDDEADAERNRHQREIVERVVEHPHDGEGADDRHGQREARDDRRGEVAQEQENHQHDQEDGEQQRELHVVDRGANRFGIVAERADVQRGRHFRLERGNQAHHVVDDLHGVGPGLTLDREHDRWLAVGPSGGLVVLHAVEHPTNVVEAHRRAVLIRDDQRSVGGRIRQLTLGVDGERLMRAVERAGR